MAVVAPHLASGVPIPQARRVVATRGEYVAAVGREDSRGERPRVAQLRGEHGAGPPRLLLACKARGGKQRNGDDHDDELHGPSIETRSPRRQRLETRSSTHSLP